jgi:predicted lipoprotein with Yx(FWY)xxD motif
VGVGYKSGIGFYLVNGTGWTLYFRTTDKPYNGTSTCTSTGCMANWPAFYTSKLTLPPGLNASSFGTITLASGSKQLTYDGYPLYYWHTDTQAGQTNGQGIGNFYACTVPTPTATTTTTTTTSTSSVA